MSNENLFSITLAYALELKVPSQTYMYFFKNLYLPSACVVQVNTWSDVRNWSKMLFQANPAPISDLVSRWQTDCSCYTFMLDFIKDLYILDAYNHGQPWTKSDKGFGQNDILNFFNIKPMDVWALTLGTGHKLFLYFCTGELTTIPHLLIYP